MKNEFIIEKKVKIPPQIRKEYTTKYPYILMEVGDSIFAPGVKYNTLAISANGWAKRQKNGTKFLARPEKEGARLWRTQ